MAARRRRTEGGPGSADETWRRGGGRETGSGTGNEVGAGVEIVTETGDIGTETGVETDTGGGGVVVALGTDTDTGIGGVRAGTGTGGEKDSQADLGIIHVIIDFQTVQI